MKGDDVAERLLEFGATVISAQQTSADRVRATPWCQVADSRHLPCLFIIAGSRLPVRHYFEPERWPTSDSTTALPIRELCRHFCRPNFLQVAVLVDLQHLHAEV